jgi:hypothetical protein
MRPIILPIALLASVLTLPLTAHADTIDQFTFNFDTTDGYQSLHLIVDLPASPPPSPWTAAGYGCPPEICFAVVDESDHFIFNFGSTGLRLAVFDPHFGPPSSVRAWYGISTSEALFTGSFSDPTFQTGTFDAVYYPFFTAPGFPGTITIEPIDTTIPEPSTLAMMATGILGAITTLRSRKPSLS